MGSYLKCWRSESDNLEVEKNLSHDINYDGKLISNQINNKGIKSPSDISQIIEVKYNQLNKNENNKNKNQNERLENRIMNQKKNELTQKKLKDKEEISEIEILNIKKKIKEDEEDKKKLDEKEKALNKRENDLKPNEEKLKQREEELIQKEKKVKIEEDELNKRKEDLNQKENKVKLEEDKLNKREADLKPKEEKLIKKEEDLDQKEKALGYNEENLKKREENLKIGESDLKQKEEILNKKVEDLKSKEEFLDRRDMDINKRENDFKPKEDELNKKNEELKQREDDVNQKEKVLNAKDEELKKKEEEMINIKEKEESLSKLDKEISEKKETIINQEKSLKEKEDKLNQRETELTQIQTRLDQDKMLQEDQMKQREDSLKQLQLKLDQEKQYIEKRRKELLPTEIGLQNIGATCYMNATLQALSNTDKFTEYFLDKYPKIQNNSNKKMSDEMYKVLFNLWDEDKKKGDYPPYDFKNALSEENSLFAGVQANDSKDLINFLLERFHHELNEPNSQTSNQNMIVNQMDEMQTLNAFFVEYFSANKSIITDLFYGIVETRSRCGGCGCTKYNFQIFSFLEFPLKEVNTFMFNNGRRMSLINQDGTNPDINLYECFDYYQKIDLMNGQNQMYCNICNFNRDTYYGSTLYSLPNFLIINLNRGKGAVYQCNVKFPETLNLLNYVTNKDKTVLQLYAVICHYGPSSMSGHFIAYCKHRKTKKWYQYNDSTVTECTQPNEYNNGMPYILFYQAI